MLEVVVSNGRGAVAFAPKAVDPDELEVAGPLITGGVVLEVDASDG